MTTTIPILQTRKLRHRDVKRLAQSHTANKWQSWDLNPGLLDRKFYELNPKRAHYWGIFYVVRLVRGVGEGKAEDELRSQTLRSQTLSQSHLSSPLSPRM